MLNRKIAVMLLSGAALAGQAGFAAADDSAVDFWNKNPRNVPAEQAAKAQQPGEERTVADPKAAAVAADKQHALGPATNPTDEYYYRHAGGVPS